MAISYKAPLRDMQFVFHEMLNNEAHYATMPAFADVNREMLDSLFEAADSFSHHELSPLNPVGDREGCLFKDGEVKTPTGFKEAYAKYVELGYPSLTADPKYGGQGMPGSVGVVVSEMMGTANWSWAMYPGLSHGAVRTIEHHGSEQQKQTYLPKLISGEWTGTMCLTEAIAGSDLGLIKTKAIPNADGTYAITGQKIFISAGQHDLSENIIHIVLARLPDAPEGTKGISLFIVPKIMVKEDGALGKHNDLSCGSIEHKMGIRASATCVMNFDGATGSLIGEPNRGLHAMFTFMNTARIGTAVQGVASAELSYQGAMPYVYERLAFRSLTGVKDPSKPADPIVWQPAVRNMLLLQKAVAEGGRALVYYLAQFSDTVEAGNTPEDRQYADEMLSLLTPIAKAFLTELGFEAANRGIQAYGGHGYITEWGMEQVVRDARISTLYEGTTEIQSLDLLGRKVLQTQGKLLRNFTKVIHKFCEANAGNKDMQPYLQPLAALNQEWGDITMKIGMKAMHNPDEAAAVAVDYMYYSGYVTLAFLWAWMALVAQDALKAGSNEKEFYLDKLKTARFYYTKMLPRARGHIAIIESGAVPLMEMPTEDFLLDPAV